MADRCFAGVKPPPPLVERLRHLDRSDLALRWRVQEVIAGRSELMPDGARHEVIGRWARPG